MRAARRWSSMLAVGVRSVGGSPATPACRSPGLPASELPSGRPSRSRAHRWSSDTTGASRQLQGIIGEIRKSPGHERFGAGPRWEELVPSVEPDWPVVYVNPAPTGTLLLILSGDDSGPSPTAEARFVEATSTEILMRLISGDGAEPGASLEDGASYLLSLSGGGTAELQAALDQLLPWLGQTIGCPIAEELRRRGQRAPPSSSAGLSASRRCTPRHGSRTANWAASPTSSISASLPRPSSAPRRCGVQRESGPRVWLP